MLIYAAVLYLFLYVPIGIIVLFSAPPSALCKSRLGNAPASRHAGTSQRPRDWTSRVSKIFQGWPSALAVER